VREGLVGEVGGKDGGWDWGVTSEGRGGGGGGEV
jgi:hypothetical protein